MPLDELVTELDALVKVIRTIPEVDKEISVIAPRIMFSTLLSNGPNTIAAHGVAGDSETETMVLNLDRSIVKGRYLENKGEIILGEKAALTLGLMVGDSIRIVTQGADYSMRLRRFTIVGLFATGLVQMDRSFFQIPLEDATEFLRTGGVVQQILILLKDYSKTDRISAILKQELAQEGLPVVGSDIKADGALNIQSWTENGEYPRLIKMMKGIYFWIELVITFLGAFIISNIMMMVVLERKREIGILKALGLDRREILRLFLAEGAFMGLIGSGAGALLGLLLCWIFSMYDIDFSFAFLNCVLCWKATKGASSW